MTEPCDLDRIEALYRVDPARAGDIAGGIIWRDYAAMTDATDAVPALVAECRRLRAALEGMRTEPITEYDALVAECRRLRAEIARLTSPDWYWPDEDSESPSDDLCALMYDCPNDGIVRATVAKRLPDVFVAWRCVTMDEDGVPDKTEPAAFDNEADAMRCWPEGLVAARAALGHTEA